MCVCVCNNFLDSILLCFSRWIRERWMGYVTLSLFQLSFQAEPQQPYKWSFKQCINYWLPNKLLKLFNNNVFLDHSNEESSLHFGVRVEGIDELMSNTKFSREELQRMYRGFKNVSTQAYVLIFSFLKIMPQ